MQNLNMVTTAAQIAVHLFIQVRLVSALGQDWTISCPCRDRQGYLDWRVPAESQSSGQLFLKMW